MQCVVDEWLVWLVLQVCDEWCWYVCVGLGWLFGVQYVVEIVIGMVQYFEVVVQCLCCWCDCVGVFVCELGCVIDCQCGGQMWDYFFEMLCVVVVEWLVQVLVVD